MIRATHLWYRYPGARVDALHGVDLTVAPGEVVGLLGPSGSGKSTTVGVLTGALAGYRGELEVLGAPGAPDRHRLARVGVGFEMPNVYTRLTARENLALFAALYPSTLDPEALLDRFGLLAVADQRVERFSKGMRQRLGLCRALLPDPSLLFLDEPTSGQDPANAHLIRRIVRERAAAGVAVLLTTHDMHVAEEVCDRVALIVGGRILACDTPRALRLAQGPASVRLELSGGTWRDCSLQELADDEGVRELLRSGAIQAVHTREPSLEDVFLDLAGPR